MDPIRPSDLEAYLDEALPPERAAEVETALRNDPQLVRQAVAVHARRDAGVHTLGEIWRHGRLSCPSRRQLGNFLLGALDDDATDYVDFHLEVIGCRYCRANLVDLENQQAEQQETIRTRRRKYFQSSAGYLQKGS